MSSAKGTDGYKFSRSQKALGFSGILVAGDGFAGNVYWLAKVDGAAEPVIPRRFEKKLALTDAGPVTKLLHGLRRARPFAASADLGAPQQVGLDEENKRHSRALLHHAKPWPYRVNANFAEHIERCWPIGDWWLLANGTLLRLQYRNGKATLRAVVMGIWV